jgi:hypothetical protein
VIKTDDAVYLGPRHIEYLGDQGNAVGRHIAKGILNAMEDGQQGTRFVLEGVYDCPHSVAVP